MELLLVLGKRRINRLHDKGQGDYELKEMIGRGAMGQVWGARQASLDRDVAIKIPNPELAAAGSFGESQFISEVVVTGQLEHPNIVPIYELGRDANGIPFYSMKHVQGKPWNEAISEKNKQENIEVLMKVCDAVAFAHAQDFLHRDIKPENVMVGEFGEVAVMDWGIAISLSEEPNRSWAALAGGPAGTPAYMAPEMAAYNSSELGVVSDVYLLGAVLYEIVTGKPPHPQASATRDALLAAASNLIVPTDQTGELVDIARKAMATDVRDRYQTVSDFQNAIRLYQSHHESLNLTQSAESHLSRAEQDGNSDEYARARFAFEESIRLWPENRTARLGLDQATLAYAKHALQEKDFSLGLSVLDVQNESHRPVFAKLKAGQVSQRRQALQIRVLVRSVVAMILVAIVSGAFYFIKLTNAYTELQEQEIELKNNAVELKNNADELEKNSERLTKINETLKEETYRANTASQAAQKAKRRAEVAKFAAEKGTYRALIGFSNQAIQRNNFLSAKKATDLGKERIPENIRHWEWGRIQHLLKDSTLRSFSGVDESEPVQCMAIEKIEDSSESFDVIAAGTNAGLKIWKIPREKEDDSATKNREPVFIAHLLEKKSVNAITIANSDDRIRIIAGYTEKKGQEKQERLAVLNLQVSKEIRVVQQNSYVLEASRGKTTSLAIATWCGKDIVLYAGLAKARDDRRTVSCFRLEANDELTRLGKSTIEHQKTIWSIGVWNCSDCEDPPTNFAKIVTASEDGDVKAWQMSGETSFDQLANFTGHRGPVYTAIFVNKHQVASGGNDRKIILWRPRSTPKEFKDASEADVNKAIDPDQGRERTDAYDARVVGYHDASIHCLAAIRDDEDLRTTIFSGSNDNSIKIWEAPDKKPAGLKGGIARSRSVAYCMSTDKR